MRIVWDYPVTENAYQKSWLNDIGLRKGFIAKIDTNLNELEATTLVDDRVKISLDREGNVLVAVYSFILRKYPPDLSEQLRSKGHSCRIVIPMDIFPERPVQMLFIQRDNVVQQILP